MFLAFHLPPTYLILEICTTDTSNCEHYSYQAVFSDNKFHRIMLILMLVWPFGILHSSLCKCRHVILNQICSSTLQIFMISYFGILSFIIMCTTTNIRGQHNREIQLLKKINFFYN